MESFGRYELRRRLGVGGMAEVYEAVAIAEHGIEKPLVIKRILEEHGSDESFQEMFRDEARVAMRLNHPNVVQVFDFGKADGRYFLAMELVRGRDLAAIIARTRQQDRVIPAGVAVFIAGEAAKGLDHAHRLAGADGKPLGIVHRDVSPQNILVSSEGAVKVGDFGIAKFNTRAGKTQVDTVRGKVRYMSPEQAEGAEIDARSDLFSLAVVLYEMITGTFAFDGRSDLDVLDQVRRCEPRKPSEITNVPSGLEAILLRALSRDAKYRFARGNEFQRELESFAVDKGLRATSGALAEFLNSLFPEIEARSSASDGATAIFRLPEGRRGAADDGIPVFVSEEVRFDPQETRESRIRRSADEETTQRPSTLTGTGEVTATREGAGFLSESDITDANEAAVVPRQHSSSDGETVVRGGLPGMAPPAASSPRSAAPADPRSSAGRPQQVAGPPPLPPPPNARGGRGAPASSAERASIARPLAAAADAPSWPPARRPGAEAATTVPAPRASAPPMEIDEEPVSRPTFERAPLNPLVAESLRERKKDPVHFKVIAIGGAVLVFGFFGFTALEPYLPGRVPASKPSVVSMGGGKGHVSVLGRTGDHVTVVDRHGETVFSISLPFKRMEVPTGTYRVIVEGPFDGVRVEGNLVVSRDETAIFDAIKAAGDRNRNTPPGSPTP